MPPKILHHCLSKLYIFLQLHLAALDNVEWLTGIVVTFVYTAVISWILLRVVNVFVPLRLDQEDETAGLDIVLHDERGYDL